MQGYQLVPGGKNVLPRRAWLHAPHRRGRNGTLNPLKYWRKSARNEVGAHFLALLGGLRAVMMVVGEGGAEAGALFVGIGMGKFQRRHLYERVVQQTRMIDQGLQDQRIEERHRAARS